MTSLSRHPARLVAAAAAAALVLAWTVGIESRPFLDSGGAEFLQLGEHLVTLAAVVLAAVPLVALRWTAVAVALGLSPLVLVVFADTGVPITVFAALVLGGGVAWQRSRAAGGVLAGAGLLVVAPVILLPVSQLDVYNVIYVDFANDSDRPQMLTAYAVVVGLVLAVAEVARRSGERAARAQALEARADEVERVSAVTEERARLARDLHDVVAHHVSLIAVRAETAPYVVEDLGAGGRTVLAEIATDSRRALDELRGVLGVLRRSEADPALAPQPTAADIPDLVDRAVDAGEQVTWSEPPTGLELVPAALGYAGYRVVQEALTNARRHASGAAADVVARGSSTGLHVRVASRLDGTPGQPGRGLTGARERVEALGGTFRAGADADTFVVEAELGA